jgi:CBS domain containing-hemolysin-like protein
MGTIIIFGIVLSFFTTCFFAGLEVGFVSLNRITVEIRKKQKSVSANLLSMYLDEPSRFIGAMITGMVIFLTFYGLLVDQLLEPIWTALSVYLSDELNPLLVLIRIVFDHLMAAGLILINYFFFRSVFRSKADTLMLFLMPVISFFFQLLDPIASRLILMAEWLLRNMLSVKIRKTRKNFNRLELEHFIQIRDDQEQGNSEINKELFEAALTLPYLKVRQCLVPRKEIEGINKNDSIDNLRLKFVETSLSKLIVFEGDIDHIIGYVHQISLFKNPASIQAAMLPIMAVPESMTATDLMNRFIRERRSMAWVVDEFGGTSGIITMEDLLEELFGEIKDEYDVEELIEREIGEGGYEFSGRIEVDKINEKYGLNLISGESETLSGYIIQYHEGIPHVREHIYIGTYDFEILDVTDTKIGLVRIQKLIHD